MVSFHLLPFSSSPCSVMMWGNTNICVVLVIWCWPIKISRNNQYNHADNQPSLLFQLYSPPLYFTSLSVFQANVPHSEGDGGGSGGQPALLRPDGHRAGRGEQIQVLRQGVDSRRQSRATTSSKVRNITMKDFQFFTKIFFPWNIFNSTEIFSIFTEIFSDSISTLTVRPQEVTGWSTTFLSTKWSWQTTIWTRMAT